MTVGIYQDIKQFPFNNFPNLEGKPLDELIVELASIGVQVSLKAATFSSRNEKNRRLVSYKLGNDELEIKLKNIYKDAETEGVNINSVVQGINAKITATIPKNPASEHYRVEEVGRFIEKFYLKN